MQNGYASHHKNYMNPGKNIKQFPARKEILL